MNWEFEFRDRLFIKLESVKGSLDTMKNNEDLQLVLHHYNSFDHHLELSSFKEKNIKYLEQMGIDYNKELPGIEDVKKVDDFVEDIKKIVNKLDNNSFLKNPIFYRIFMTNYLEVFEDLIVDYKNQSIKS